MDHLTRKRQIEANLKKAFRFKRLELCKTRTKKSSPDLFNFYVVLASHDMVTDAGRATTCRRKFKAPWFQTKIQKTKGFPKTWVLTGKSLKISDEKKHISCSDQTTPSKTRSLNATNEDGAFVCNQQEFYSTQLGKKEIRSKLLELCKTRTKKSSLDMLNFYLVSATRHMVTDNDSSTTCRRKFKDPSLKVNTKNERPSQKHGFHLITVWRFQTEKNQKLPSWHEEQNKGKAGPHRQKLNMDHLTRKRQIEANLKKAFRFKLSELCKTRTKKSSPDLFNF